MSIRVIRPLDNVPEPDEYYLRYLDRLRDSGVTNMFGASRYLRMEFPELSVSQSRAILAYWMDTFAKRHPK